VCKITNVLKMQKFEHSVVKIAIKFQKNIEKILSKKILYFNCMKFNKNLGQKDSFRLQLIEEIGKMQSWRKKKTTNLKMYNKNKTN
jgi:hypothetical protein